MILSLGYNDQYNSYKDVGNCSRPRELGLCFSFRKRCAGVYSSALLDQVSLPGPQWRRRCQTCLRSPNSFFPKKFGGKIVFAKICFMFRSLIFIIWRLLRLMLCLGLPMLNNLMCNCRKKKFHVNPIFFISFTQLFCE